MPFSVTQHHWFLSMWIYKDVQYDHYTLKYSLIRILAHMRVISEFCWLCVFFCFQQCFWCNPVCRPWLGVVRYWLFFVGMRLFYTLVCMNVVIHCTFWVGRNGSPIPPDRRTSKYIKVTICMQPVVYGKTKLQVTVLGSRVLLVGWTLWDSDCDWNGLWPPQGFRWLVYDFFALYIARKQLL